MQILDQLPFDIRQVGIPQSSAHPPKERRNFSNQLNLKGKITALRAIQQRLEMRKAKLSPPAGFLRRSLRATSGRYNNISY